MPSVPFFQPPYCILYDFICIFRRKYLPDAKSSKIKKSFCFNLLHPVACSAYNKHMKSNRKTLSVILFILAGICILAAIILFVRGHMEDRHMEESLDALRPTESPAETVPSSEPETIATATTESAAEEAFPLRKRSPGFPILTPTAFLPTKTWAHGCRFPAPGSIIR